MTPILSSDRFRFELITKSHDVVGFDCENQWLTKFLVDDALNETLSDLSRTTVLIDTTGAQNKVVGYFTLHADSIYAERSNGAGTYLYPLVYLSALARDRQWKGQNLGDFLLLEAFRCVVAASEIIGIAGIHLDTTLQGQRLYEGYGFHNHPEGGTKRLISLDSVRAIVRALNEGSA